MKKGVLKICVLILVLSFFGITNFYAQSQGMVSIVIDPKMAVEGPYKTSEHGELDITLRVACHHLKYEIGAFTELFPAIEYYGFGLFFKYKFLLEKNPKKFNRWVLPIGADVGFIKRNQEFEEKVLMFNFAIDGGVRFFITKNIGLELGINYRYRSDLEEIYQDNFQMRYNVYSGLVFVWE